MQRITVYNAHCCGEVGDVVVGLDNFNLNSPQEGSIALFKDKTWRNFYPIPYASKSIVDSV